MRRSHSSKSHLVIIVATQGPIFPLCTCSIRLPRCTKKERTMMTQPIQKFQKLTTEVSAGGNDLTRLGFSFDDRRLAERRARFARAAVLADGVTEGLLWLGRQAKRFFDAIK